MIRDYFDRKKIYFTNSGLIIFISLILLLGIIGCNAMSFIMVALYMSSINVLEVAEIWKIDSLLPITKEEKRRQFLFSKAMDILILGILLVVNVFIVSFWIKDMYAVCHPIYGCLSFIACIIYMYQQAVESISYKTSLFGRIKKHKDKGTGVRVYDAFVLSGQILVFLNLALNELDILLGKGPILGRINISVLSLAMLYSVIILSVDAVKHVRGKYEY